MYLVLIFAREGRSQYPSFCAVSQSSSVSRPFICRVASFHFHFRSATCTTCLWFAAVKFDTNETYVSWRLFVYRDINLRGSFCVVSQRKGIEAQLKERNRGDRQNANENVEHKKILTCLLSPPTVSSYIERKKGDRRVTR